MSIPWRLSIYVFVLTCHSLAWTELYLTLGMMFRRYKFELFEADVTDVEMAHDFFIPVTRLDSKGVRVFATSTAD